MNSDIFSLKLYGSTYSKTVNLQTKEGQGLGLASYPCIYQECFFSTGALYYVPVPVKSLSISKFPCTNGCFGEVGGEERGGNYFSSRLEWGGAGKLLLFLQKSFLTS